MSTGSEPCQGYGGAFLLAPIILDRKGRSTARSSFGSAQNRVSSALKGETVNLRVGRSAPRWIRNPYDIYVCGRTVLSCARGLEDTVGKNSLRTRLDLAVHCCAGNRPAEGASPSAIHLAKNSPVPFSGLYDPRDRAAIVFHSTPPLVPVPSCMVLGKELFF